MQETIGRAWSRSWPVVSDLVTGFQSHRVSMLAKQAAYSLLYALPAMIALLVSLAALVDRYTDSSLSEALQREIDERAPEELEPLLDSLVQHAAETASNSSAVVGALIAFGVAIWGGAGGVDALIYACNRVFDVSDKRSYVARKALTLGLTFGGGAMVITAFILILIGERLSDWIAEETGHRSSLIDLLVSGNLGSALLVFLATAALYVLAPAAPNSARWVLPGTVLVTLATLVVFVSFDLLVRLVDPGSAFGAAGSILVLLWLLYLESAIVVAGAILNAVLSHRYDARLIDFLHDHPERRLPPQR